MAIFFVGQSNILNHSETRVKAQGTKKVTLFTKAERLHGHCQRNRHTDEADMNSIK